MELPLVDLPARPALRRARRPDPRPLPGALGGPAAAARRTSSSAPTRSPRSRPARASIRRCPPHPATHSRVEHEYQRRGALCYLAAWDAWRAKVFDRCAPKDGIEPFDALVEQFMSVEPYRSAQRVFVIVDNASAHRGQRSIDRLRGAWSNLILVHTPVHASWLNQAAIYFSVTQRKVLQPNNFKRRRRAQAHPAGLRPPLRTDRQTV